ncbi:MAG: arsenate reductase ArsC [Pseudomonadota bacterium]
MMIKRALFLCTGNSARSIMAEAYFRHASKGQWEAYSAGSSPTGVPNPYAIKTLEAKGIDPGAPRSKSWDEFAVEGAPVMDLVVTVCDNAANEVCPVWTTTPGHAAPEKLHWSFPDPAAVQGDADEKSAAFQEIFHSIRTKIDDYLGLPA